MTAPSVSNRLDKKDEEVVAKINVDFDDLVTYLTLRNNGSVPWNDVVTYGPWVDVRAYDNINAAITAISTTTATLLIPNAQTLTANLTVPSNVTLWFLRSGSIVKASTYTLTINGPVLAQDYQIFSGFSAGNVTNLQVSYPDWFGTGATAFQQAIQSLVPGGTLQLWAKTYTIASNVSYSTNRMTIKGISPEATLINFTPTANNVIALASSGGLDNVKFADFTLQLTNPTSFTGSQGITVAANDTKFTFERVFFTKFNKRAIDFAAGTYYMIIKECRFIRTQDTTSAILPIAINTSGSNVFNIYNCYFSENDRDINIAAGTAIQIQNNNFEVGGDSGNTNIDYSLSINGVNNLIFSGNYSEGNFTNGVTGAFLRINNCVDPLIESNYFNGQDGSTDKTDCFIRVVGASTRNPVIRSNNFVEIKTYFVDNAVPVKLADNYYYDGGAEKTTYATITPYISDITQLDIDLMGDYSGTSTVGGFASTSVKKIWFEKMDDIVHVQFEIVGVSNATTVSFTLPFTNAGDWSVNAVGLGHDNSADLTAPVYISVATSSATCNIFKTFSAGAWTNINNKKVYGQFFYKAA